MNIAFCVVDECMFDYSRWCGLAAADQDVKMLVMDDEDIKRAAEVIGQRCRGKKRIGREVPSRARKVWRASSQRLELQCSHKRSSVCVCTA